MSNTMVCDYLVVGAGAASLSFIDTILTEFPSAKIVIVDKHPSPGGHWNDAYEFVRLHQPSLLYGVASRQLEGNWLRLLTKGILPWTHRASKRELLTHFQDLVDDWVAKGQVRYFPDCEYDFRQDVADDFHTFSHLDGSRMHSVRVDVKLVNGVLGECKVPSRCPVAFPVDEEVDVVTPNELHRIHTKVGYPRGQKFVVLGFGKTAMDTVVYLQAVMKIRPDDITWVVPNDVWMLNRSGPGGPGSYPRALLQCNGNEEEACLLLSKNGVFLRLDEKVQPTKFRFPVVAKDELKLMRKVKHVVRCGRVTSISFEAQNSDLVVNFGPDQEPLSLTSTNDHTFVHCMSPGPFNGNVCKELYVSEKEMNLALLFSPPVSISMSCLAKLESARRKGTLDINFGRKLLVESKANGLDWDKKEGIVVTENDVLKGLVQGFALQSDTTKGQLDPIKSLAMFLALVGTDPMVGYKWMSGNRLSFLSIPAFKCKIYEDLVDMVSNKKDFGFSESDVKMFTMLADKLKPLEGK